MFGPLFKGIGIAASPKGRKAIRKAIVLARTEEGQKAIAQVRKVAATPEGRKLLGDAAKAAARAGKAAGSPERLKEAARLLRERR